MEHKGTIQIETEHLLLRRFRPDDLMDIYENCWADPDVWKFTSYEPMKCVEDVVNKAGMFTKKWFDAYERPNRYSWAIELKKTGKPIGRMFGMHPDDKEQSVELAYELGKAWWNQGLMTEAVRAVIDFFLDDVGMQQIYASVSSDNPASGKVLQKAGMRYQAVHAQTMKDNHGISDEIVYAVFRTVARRDEAYCTRTRLAEIALEQTKIPLHGYLDGIDTNLHPVIAPFRKWNLKSADRGWCAAFVYYCCLLNGFEIPYKPRECNDTGSLAGCGSWEMFAQTNSGLEYHLRDDKLFTHEIGDIVLFDHVFCDKEHDHIGIILSVEPDRLITAEGNAGNTNTAMVMERPRNEHIRGYIRIPDCYRYSDVV